MSKNNGIYNRAIQNGVNNRDIINKPVYKQEIANDYREIETISNKLIENGFNVESIIPANSGKYVVLGRRG